jgi:sugar/nucleoside kinase (ribokinase family)
LRYDLIVAGHIVIDYIHSGDRTHGPYLGGPCVYSGLAARALEASVSVVSKVGSDFGNRRMLRLRSRGFSTNRIRLVGSSTTSFLLSYKDGHRRLEVRSHCEPIHDSDLAGLPSSRALHVGPVLNEISPQQVSRLAEKGVILSLDPQGYFRRILSDGLVRTQSWHNRLLLKKVTVLKISEEELTIINGKRHLIRKLSRLGPEIILLTKGKQGTIVWSENEGIFHVPVYRTVVKDPTGAGDALVGAFLVTWARTGDLLWSASVGSAVASFVVSKFGPTNFGSRRRIEHRANQILQSVETIGQAE